MVAKAHQSPISRIRLRLILWLSNAVYTNWNNNCYFAIEASNSEVTYNLNQLEHEDEAIAPNLNA